MLGLINKNNSIDIIEKLIKSSRESFFNKAKMTNNINNNSNIVKISKLIPKIVPIDLYMFRSVRKSWKRMKLVIQYEFVINGKEKNKIVMKKDPKKFLKSLNFLKIMNAAGRYTIGKYLSKTAHPRKKPDIYGEKYFASIEKSFD